MTKIIYGPPRQGKTTKLVKLSAFNGGTIFTKDVHCVRQIRDVARKLDLKIPIPMTFMDIIDGTIQGMDLKSILIDDTMGFVRFCIRYRSDIEAVTLDIGRDELLKLIPEIE